MEVSELLKSYPRSGIRVMFDLAEQYPQAIRLTVGQPNFITPRFIRDAAFRSMNDGNTGYVSNAGIPALRAAIAARTARRLRIPCEAENIMVAAGGMEALLFAMAAVVNPGDEVIVPDPGYPNYRGQIALLHGVAVPVPLYEENGFRLRAEDLEARITSRTRAVILNYPSNPTGAALDRAEIERIAEVILRHGLMAISDEVYDTILYDGRTHFSIAQVPGMEEHAAVINSMSKSFAMTGWRLGYLAADRKLVEQLPKLQEALISCVPGFIQDAAVTALTDDHGAAEEMAGHYAGRRDILVNGLNEIPGFRCGKGQGAFYAFANIQAFGKNSLDFARELLTEAGVVGVHGSAFGDMGEGYIRFSYANSDENLQEALRRLKEHVKKNY